MTLELFRKKGFNSGMFRSIFFTAFFLLTAILAAQTATPSPTPKPDASVNHRLWKCITPGGTYEVLVSAIVSVSMSEYIVNNEADVNEVNVDTRGNALVRFYYIEPVTPNAPNGIGQMAIDKAKELAEEAKDRTQQDSWDKVQKTYPTTTHAHTIEYRVDSLDQLNQIFHSADQAFEKGSGTTLVIQPPKQDSGS